MGNGDILSHMVGFMTDAAILAGIPLVIATIAGLTVSIFQAMTQVQDQNLSQTVKILAMVLVFLATGTMLAKPLVQRTESVFSQLHNY